MEDYSGPQKLDDFLNWKPVYPKPLIGAGLLYPQTRMMLYGRYKSLKSMMFLGLAKALASGRPWMGFGTPPGGIRVIYLQLEIPKLLLHKRLARMDVSWEALDDRKSYSNTREKLYVWTEPFLKLDRSEGMALLEKHIDLVQPAVVMIDPVYKIISGNILDPNHVRQVCDSLDMLLAKTGISIILAHHARKSAISEDSFDLGSDDMLGAAVFSYWADTILKLVKIGEKDNQIGLQMSFDVVRHTEEELEPKNIIFDRSDLMFREGEPLISIQRGGKR